MEMMHHEAGVRTVVVGGRPETGPMQAPAGTRGALSYDSVSLDVDIGNAETINITTTSYLPDRAEDQAVWISTASFNMLDQVRSELEIDINSIQHVESNRTALTQAANLGYESIVSKLLEHPDIEVNLQDTLGYTALSLATVKGFHSIVELLLMHPDIELDIKEFKNGRSALVLAAERDDARTVHMLLQSGADGQMKDHQGGTAALRAVDYGCTLALNVLKSDNASLHCVDEDGRTLLHGASRGGHSEILSLLVKEGLDKD